MRRQLDPVGFGPARHDNTLLTLSCAAQGHCSTGQQYPAGMALALQRGSRGASGGASAPGRSCRPCRMPCRARSPAACTCPGRSRRVPPRAASSACRCGPAVPGACRTQILQNWQETQRAEYKTLLRTATHLMWLACWQMCMTDCVAVRRAHAALVPERTALCVKKRIRPKMAGWAAQLSFSAAHWEALLRVLACSDSTLRHVVQRWPGIARVPVPEVMQRLLSLKVRGASRAAAGVDSVCARKCLVSVHALRGSDLHACCRREVGAQHHVAVCTSPA